MIRFIGIAAVQCRTDVSGLSKNAVSTVVRILVSLIDRSNVKQTGQYLMQVD